jgi:GNAT superfamily N-acetyltransferase
MENAIEYAKLKGLDIKEAKLNPKQRSTVDSYLKNPAEFERQKEESESLELARTEALRRDQEKRVAERLEAEEKREEEARFKAVIDTTIRSTEAQLKRDIAAKKISTKDARAMLEAFPSYPQGVIKPYTIRLIEKRAGAEPSFKKLRKTVTEDGFNIQNPVMTGLVDIGYEMLDLRNPRTYVDKNGTPFRTFEKNGVRVALEPGKVLFKQKGKEYGRVGTAIGNENDITVEHLVVDPEFRKQGLARQTLKDLTFLADRNEINMYLEPAQLEESGMNKDQLSKLYGEFLWEPTNESGSPMKRVPESYEERMDRINAELKAEGREHEVTRAAKELAEVKAKIARLQETPQEETILTPPQQKILEKEVDKLSDSEIATLEQHYGVDNYSLTFLKRVREDAVKYINDGANAVDKAVRSIISKIAAAILSVAIVFNPNFMSDASAVVIPQQVVEVRAEVPKDASGMSDAGKKAYSTLYPALKQGLQKNNKYFTVVDKPTSQMYVFNPDGSMLLKSNVLLGSQFGDAYVGQTDFKQNRMTPAGLFKPKAEKGSATYDGKTVYTFGNVKEGWNAVFMHSVYLKAGDAEARLKALDTGDRTRLSYGCVNGPEAVMNKLDNPSMDESHVFIVPDNQAAVDDYIANRVSNEDLTRETVKPVTKKVPSERAKTMTTQEVFGREEELPLEVKKTQAEINRERQNAKKAVAESEDKTIFYGNFTGNLSKSDLDAMNQEVRDEKIIEIGKISRKITNVTKKIAQVGGDIQIQKNLNYLLGKKADLRNEIDALKGERRSAEWFRARAAEELAKGNLMPETMAVVDELYRKYPSFLEGLKLSVRGGKRAGVEGSFEPVDRLVSIFINPFSITQDETMRHEIMHSLELMMNPDAQKALVSAWGDALGKAIQKHKDPRSQEFFNAVLDYVENPTRANFDRATNKMPSIGEFYQYMNPSEFWAVNGEKLMKAQLGTGWNRFVKGVQKILEALKSVFGFDNRYAVHREFDRLMKGESGQMTDTMLAEYVKRGDMELDFLNQVEDVDELLEKHERPNAPLHPSDKLKDRLLQKTESITELFDQYKNNPSLETSKMIGAADRAITYARNKNVWFGTALELADLKRYNGQLRDDKGFAVASIALTNAVHAGHVGTQVITHGGLRFDPVTQQFTAYDSKYSLANVVREKTKLIAKLGEQRAADVIQAFFEAKRSRSIQNEFYDRQAEFENLKAEFESEVDPERKDELYKEMMAAEEDLRRVMVALDKVNMTDEAIDDFIALEKKYPELKEMMRNWTAVNQNMIDNMEFSGIISKKRAERLRAIKDYVPWYRIQDDMADPHDRPAQGVRGLTNVAGEKKFKKGQTDKDIDDIVDNMIHNVMMTTRNSIRNYAANRIAQQYATRNDKDKIKVFPQEGKTADGAVRVNILANGRRIVIEIKDPLIAEAVLGMESIEIPMINALGVMANGLRRGITSFPIFQIKQLFMDAPTAAWVSGVKNPFKVWADTFASFVAALNPNDPIVKMMKNYGIGGYQSSARTPEKELKMQIGLIGRSPLAYLLKTLDHIGDASDYAQRRAVYKQVLKETGDEMQALLQANNVIDFLKHGSGRAAQATVRTVAFMNAYAQSMDVMAQAMAGGGLKGRERKHVFAQFVKTGMVLASLSLLYSFAVGDDEEYQKMDDQTKLRNFIIPKSMTKYIGMDNSIKVPMHTSASFFFKSMPELLYNKIMNEGTKNHMDNQRLRTALKEAATDALLGPNVTPTGVKPFLEIALNKNFFTGGTLTPKGMENLEAFRQYTASTSELGKVISKGTLGLLNPIEADHLMKGLLGTVGAAAMWGSNMFSGDRAEPNASANPFYGAFVSAPVPRGPEDIYYDLKERSTKVHNTFVDMMKKGRATEAREYRKENELLFKAYGYTNGVEQGLKQLNAEIRRISDLPGDKLTPEQKRERITYYQQKKNDILKDVIEYRKKAGL